MFLTAYARVYFTKVREHLGEDSAAYAEFAKYLNDLYAHTSSVQAVYKTIEDILSPELVEEFVIFLTPEQAVLCGKEFQHFLLVRMREFFVKLKVSTLKKIFNLIIIE